MLLEFSQIVFNPTFDISLSNILYAQLLLLVTVLFSALIYVLFFTNIFITFLCSCLFVGGVLITPQFVPWLSDVIELFPLVFLINIFICIVMYMILNRKYIPFNRMQPTDLIDDEYVYSFLEIDKRMNSLEKYSASLENLDLQRRKDGFYAEWSRKAKIANSEITDTKDKIEECRCDLDRLNKPIHNYCFKLFLVDLFGGFWVTLSICFIIIFFVVMVFPSILIYADSVMLLLAGFITSFVLKFYIEARDQLQEYIDRVHDYCRTGTCENTVTQHSTVELTEEN